MGGGVRRRKRRRSALAGVTFVLLFIPLSVAGNHNWLHLIFVGVTFVN